MLGTCDDLIECPCVGEFRCSHFGLGSGMVDVLCICAGLDGCPCAGRIQGWSFDLEFERVGVLVQGFGGEVGSVWNAGFQGWCLL